MEQRGLKHKDIWSTFSPPPVVYFYSALDTSARARRCWLNRAAVSGEADRYLHFSGSFAFPDRMLYILYSDEV